MNNYALAYDVIAALGMSNQLAAFVKDNRNILQWSQPFSGLYLLKSEASLATLIESFQGFFGYNVGHFITPIQPMTSGGILRQEIWTWLNAPVSPSGGIAPAGLLASMLASSGKPGS